MLVKENSLFDTKTIQVINDSGLDVTLSTFGAGVVSLKLNDKPMILEMEDYQDYMYSNGYHGKTLGVVAGRLKKDGFILNREYHLVPAPDRNFSLHGGMLKSISFRNWNYKVTESNKKVSVVFDIKTKDKENGFPGKARIFVTYEIYKEKNVMRILFKATTPSEATFINLSNHMYFNLNSHDISDYYLKMNCDQVAITDDTLLIYDKQPITEYLDFRKSSKMNPRLEKIEKHDFKETIDDTFLYDSLPGKVFLKNGNLSLSIITDNPAMNIFVDNYPTDKHFKNRTDFTNRRAIALEPQRWLLDESQIILKKGEVYKNYIEYRFKEN